MGTLGARPPSITPKRYIDSFFEANPGRADNHVDLLSEMGQIPGYFSHEAAKNAKR